MNKISGSIPINPGAHIGPYEVRSLLGAGGMGEVYRGYDPRIGREVAIKVLPASVAGDADRLRRFEQEARSAGALNHPNILAIYDIGNHEGLPYLVTELLEGQTLRARLQASPLPVRKISDYSLQVCRGLAAAHDRGIIHRDLKPENLFVTKDGHVKILDFGLAKLILKETGERALSEIPTVNSTGAGIILGTVGYMSPEQVRGEKTDARSDIFSFGAILYEMISGRRAFDGATSADRLSAILKDEPPPLAENAPRTPPALMRIMDHALEKAADDRFRTVHDLIFALESISAQSSEASGTSPMTPLIRTRRWIKPLAWMLAGIILGAVIAWVLPRIMARPAKPQTIRFQTALPPDLHVGGIDYPEISPDGSAIAFIGIVGDGKQQIWIYRMDTAAWQPLAGTEGARMQPFWSPDSSTVAFFADGKLKRIPANGGPVQVLCQAVGRGGTWSRDGIILFGNVSAGISRVPASGGTPSPATKLDSSGHEANHRWPLFLPDGRHFLYVSYPATGTENQNGGIFAGSLDSPDKKLVLAGDSNVAYVPPGYLLFYRDGNIVAQRFDQHRLQVIGDPVPVVEHVRYYSAAKFALFSASDTNLLTFMSALPTAPSQLRWYERDGSEAGSAGETGFIGQISLSRDGRQVAYTLLDAQTSTSSISVRDLSSNRVTRLAAGEPGSQGYYCPVWSPDGRFMAFAMSKTGPGKLYRMSVDGTSAESALWSTENTDQLPADWSPDGLLIAYVDPHPLTGGIYVAPSAGGQKPKQIIARGIAARFSPNGAWVAYQSRESGRSEIYVTPFPGPGPRIPISNAGGMSPRWRRDGKEMYYLGLDDKVMAVDIQMTPMFQAGVPHALFQARPAGGSFAYDVSADGKRFLVNTLIGEDVPPSMTVLLNWANGLKN